MSAGEQNYSKSHVLGNVRLPRNINPRIRASIRRDDPDGGNDEPHYTGLNGTTLNLDISPTGALVINFLSDDLDDTLAVLNAADPSNLKAFEEDGYLVLQNLNGGEKNYLEVVSGDAAPILGFVTSPEPGSKSFAGELASAPPGRYQDQDNPQGTTYIAGDEDLTSDSLNRALAGAFVETARIAQALDVLVPTVQEFTGAVATHAGSGKKVVYIQDADLRIPVNGYGITGTTQSARELDAVVQILNTDDEPIIDIDQATERYARVLDIYSEASGTGSGSLNNGASVAAFGTPDGRSIFGPTVPLLNKQGATAISNIRGDLIVANGASFQTAGVQPGDTAIIESATNGVPFSHNGEFIVEQVLSETLLAVRAKSEFEPTFVSTEKPRELNKDLPGGSAYGTVRVIVGNYFSAKDSVAFEVPSWVANATNVKVRCVSGARMRNLGLGDLMRALAPNQGSLLKEFKDHIVDGVVGRRHTADQVDAPAVVGTPDSLTAGTVEEQLAELLNHVNTAIAGQISYGGGIDWADDAGDTPAGPTTNPATDLETQVDKILSDLAGPGIDGVAKIRALAAGDLLGGNLRDQLNQLDIEWAKLDRNNTFTGVQSFDNTARVGEATGETVAGLISDVSPTNRKLLWESTGNTSDASKVRLYTAGNSGWEITVNAEWNGAQWSADVNNSKAARVRMGNDIVGLASVFSVDWFDSTGATWVDGSWDTILSLDQFKVESILDTPLTLQKAIRSIGGDLVGTLANVVIPRIKIPIGNGGLGSNDKVQLFQIGNDVDRIFRIYMSDEAVGDADFRTLEITWNAFWDSSSQAWAKDDTGLNSSRFRFNRNHLQMDFQTTGAGTWGNSAWGGQNIVDFSLSGGGDLNLDSSLVVGAGVTIGGNSTFNGSTFTFNGNIHVNNPSEIELDNTYMEWVNTTSAFSSGVANPTALVTVANRVFAKNTIKCYGRVQNGLAQEGYNSFAFDGGGSTVAVEILANMANSLYSVLLTPHDLRAGGGPYSDNHTMRAHSLFTGSFRVVGYEIDGGDGGALIDLNTFGDWSYLVIGRQDT